LRYIKGLITKVFSDFYRVKTEEGYIECNARGIFKKNKISPIVGDIVEINSSIVIEKILPRKNEFIRPPIANIDQLIIVVATTNPKPDLLLLDKQIAMAEINNVIPIICVNKIDLKSEEYITNVYTNIGYTVITTNARDGVGFEKMAGLLFNKTTAFTGNSGVGKSAITNKIFNKELSEEGETSQKLEHGKHTTKFVELFELSDNTFIADTPGFSTYEINGIDAKDLDKYFIEFEKYFSDCEYRGCSHIKEEKCGVKEATNAGKIDLGRYERYCTIYKKLKENRGRYL
jgi:ribosome biogenesis GTPase